VCQVMLLSNIIRVGEYSGTRGQCAYGMIVSWVIGVRRIIVSMIIMVKILM
jgi:hypothetical protein